MFLFATTSKFEGIVWGFPFFLFDFVTVYPVLVHSGNTGVGVLDKGSFLIQSWLFLFCVANMLSAVLIEVLCLANIYSLVLPGVGLHDGQGSFPYFFVHCYAV
ncbi:hypothetical protein J3E68DRAFT_403102 [Trichoderma sp. SZMC 28012]